MVLVKILPEKYQKYLFWVSAPFSKRYRTVSCDITPNISRDIYTDDYLGEIEGKVEDFFEKVFQQFLNMSMLQQMLYLDTKYWLADDLLIKADKMTMAASVELRVPFLDHKLVEFAFNIPDHIKIQGSEGKLILKKTVEGILPNEVIYRKKKGFPVPISKWFSGDLHNIASEVLLDEKTLNRGYFKRIYIEKILRNHKDKSQDFSRRIFSLLVLELWHRMYMEENNLT